MTIRRKRFVVMRKNRTEIWGGCSRHFYFKPINDIGDFPVKTYRSEKQAKASCSSWNRDFEIVPVYETIAEIKKPHRLDGIHYCECGNTVKSYEKYCCECGQALDWSDTE